MEKKKEWLVFGILIIPFVIIVSLLIGLYTEEYNLWLILPSILFKQMFEKCCMAFSDNVVANFIFAIVLWFLIGSAIGKTAFFSTVFKKGKS